MAKEKKRSVGRPPSDAPKANQVMTRLDAPTFAALGKAAEVERRAPAWLVREATVDWLKRSGYLPTPKP